MRNISILLLCVLSIGCSSSQNGQNWLDLPERKLSSYSSSMTEPFVTRIASMPPIALDYLQKMAPKAGFKSYQPTREETAIFQQYFDLLPVQYKRTMEAKVAKIYFVENFDSGAMSDVVFDDKKEMYIVLYINRKLLNTSLSDWISFRDTSSFYPKKGISILSVSSEEYYGLIHALIHEACHIYDYYHHVTPYVEEFQKASVTERTTAFVKSVWTDLHVPTSENNVLGGSNYSGYGLRGRIDISNAQSLYKKLSGSPFASLYGATSWAEDFAESFSWWFMKWRLGINYSVSVQVDGNDVVRFTPFETPYSVARTVIFEEISR